MICSTAERRKAFTLIELTLSMAALGVLMAAISSAIVITTHALPDGRTVADDVTDGYFAASQITEDLRTAMSFSERTPTAVTFMVPDRTKDASPDTIRYSWSGTAGEPLTREFNSGTAVNIIADVREFQLDYVLTVIVEQPDPITNESGEQELFAYTTAASPADFSLTDKNWIGQYFMPVLPADAAEWSVTRVKIMARSNGTTKGITNVELRLPTVGNLPGSTVIESATMSESTLDTAYLWEEFAFSSVSTLSPSSGLVLVTTMNKRDTVLADILFDSSGGSGRVTTSNGGSSWTLSSSQSMLLSVYGTVVTVTHTRSRDAGMAQRGGSQTTHR